MCCRKYLLQIFFFIVLFICLAYRKEKPADPDTGIYTGLVCLKGDPYGIGVEKIVGSAGDTIVSDDGHMQIIIPPGALSGNTSIRIQPVSNTNPAGTDLNYRISPQLNFNRPATIRFSYGSPDSINFSPCNIGLSFQDASGIWKMKTARTLDETNRTISGETTQTGDWCLMAPIRLVPVESYIKPGQQVTLQVLGFIPIAVQDICGAWQSPDFRHADVAINGGAPVLPELISKWTLLTAGRGMGSLTPQGARAIYKASGIDNPDMNPATVAVILKGSTFPMFARIFVEPEDEFMIITMGDNTYRYTDVDVIADGNGSEHHGITWKDMLGGNEIGYITWKGRSTGNHIWDDSENQFWFAPMSFDGAFLNSFVGDLNQRPSSGSVTIERFGKPGEFVTGSFILTNAGHRVPDDIYKGTHKVKGRFKIRRSE